MHETLQEVQRYINALETDASLWQRKYANLMTSFKEQEADLKEARLALISRTKELASSLDLEKWETWEDVISVLKNRPNSLRLIDSLLTKADDELNIPIDVEMDPDLVMWVDYLCRYAIDMKRRLSQIYYLSLGLESE